MDNPGTPLNKEGEQYIRQVVNSLFYYARAGDLKIFFALSTISTKQANPTYKTMARTQQLLDYMSHHPNAKIQFHASDMVLNIHSNVSYLSTDKGRSFTEGYFSLIAYPRIVSPSGLTAIYTYHVLSSS